MSGQTVMISGADGFLGRALAAAFAGAGWQVFGLVRNSANKTLPGELSDAFEYSFPDRIAPAAFEIPVDLFVHCAFTSQMTANTDAGFDMAAARFLLKRFESSRFVFVSSMSAHPNAYSRYGLSKLAIEKLMDPSRDIVVRPGFIVGYGGVFRRLALVLAKFPVVPLFFGGSRPIQTVYVDDVCRSILRLVEERRAGVWPVGEEIPLTIRGFYETLTGWLCKRPLFLPLPATLALDVLRLVELSGVRLPMTSENLLGLKGLISYDISPTIDAVGFRPISFAESLKLMDPGILQRP
jgi:NADH dehydrogenase